MNDGKAQVTLTGAFALAPLTLPLTLEKHGGEWKVASASASSFKIYDQIK